MKFFVYIDLCEWKRERERVCVCVLFITIFCTVHYLARKKKRFPIYVREKCKLHFVCSLSLFIYKCLGYDKEYKRKCGRIETGPNAVKTKAKKGEKERDWDPYLC